MEARRGFRINDAPEVAGRCAWEGFTRKLRRWLRWKGESCRDRLGKGGAFFRRLSEEAGRLHIRVVDPMHGVDGRSDMKLDDAQMARVRQWIEQGMKVAEVQNRLAEEFGLRLTYMEARFLLDDLQLKPKDPPPAPKAAANVGGSSLASAGRETPGVGGGSAGGGLAGPSGAPLKTTPMGGVPGGVSVSVDSLARPGALVSGKVTFSDGQGADWQMDQYGRLGLAPKVPGYKPTQADLASFQAELEAAMARMGY